MVAPYVSQGGTAVLHGTLGSVDRVELLLSSYPFCDLTPAAVEHLADTTRSKHYDTGSFVFHVGDPADALYIVADGQLKECLVSAHGEELNFEIFTTGAVFGEPGLFAPERNRVVDVVAMTPTQLLIVPRDALVDFALGHPPVLLRLLEGFAAQVRSLTEDAAGLAYHPIRERLAIKLLELAATHGQPGSDGVRIVLDITQSQLAAMIGASRPNVNRALASLAAEHAVVSNNGRVRFVDPARLAAFANRSTVLHRRNRILAPSEGSA